jgi:protoheme IX farnesyltransferase
MKPEPAQTQHHGLRAPWLLGALALAAYAGTLAGAAQPDVAGLAVTLLALTLLGAATAAAAALRVGTPESRRLGARAQAARRRYLSLAVGAALAVYAVLVFGTLVTSVNTRWDCATLPLCPTDAEMAVLHYLHRGTAVFATALVGWLAIATWRQRPEHILRAAAAWCLGLMLAQNAVGIAQIAAASAGAESSLMAARLAHLAVGALTWAMLAALAMLAYRLPYPAGEGQAVRDAGAAGAAPATPLGMTDRALLTARPSLLKDYISLTKPGVITLLIFTTITSMDLTPAGPPSLTLVLWTALGGWLMASGSHALNCYFDKDIDINMGRTGRRPIPSGRIPAWHALVLGLALGAIAFVLLAALVNMAAALLALAGLFYYVVIYTLWLKRTSWNNIVIGGGAGAFPPLVGWAAAAGQISWAALLLWLIIFYWTPPHFWALAIVRAKDYARAGVPMLPVVAGDEETRRQIMLYSVQLFVITLLPSLVGMLGVPYLLAAVALGGLFLFYAARMQRDHSAGATWALYKYSLLYLALLFVAMVVDRVALA